MAVERSRDTTCDDVHDQVAPLELRDEAGDGFRFHGGPAQHFRRERIRGANTVDHRRRRRD
jgi:hypothetical protein